jgi:hypothetical protein
VSLLDLRKTVLGTLARHREELDAARAREPDLAGFDRATATTAPRRRSHVTTDAQVRTVLALLREYQRSKRALWAGALLVTLYPMLAATVRRLRMPHARRDERDAVVLEVFYVEAARVRASGPRALGVLRRAVERGSFAAAQAARRMVESEAAFAQECGGNVVTPDLDLYVDLARSERALRDVATSLRLPAAAANTDLSDAERARRYERLKKRRTRARARLRTAFRVAA